VAEKRAGKSTTQKRKIAHLREIKCIINSRHHAGNCSERHIFKYYAIEYIPL
jgi:hypothetical protein